jgi:hypothetical protein
LNFAAPFTGANQSLAASGYQKLPGGLILQWGKVTFSGGLASATFPIAFPAAIWGLHSSLELLTFTGSADATTVRSISTTGFTLNNYYVSVPSAYWFALGN